MGNDKPNTTLRLGVRPVSLAVFDTTVCDNNLGNQIIMDGVHRALRSVFGEAFIYRLPYLEGLGRQARSYLSRCDHAFFGGGNCISGDMARFNQWGFGALNALRLPRMRLLGVGWWQYQDRVSRYSRWVLERMLDRRGLHAVRDSYTLKRLHSLGFDNVVNTGCPSMWDLTEAHCAGIPNHAANDVITTVTCYKRDPSADRAMLKTLTRLYRHVYLWVQSPDDLTYAGSLGATTMMPVAPTLESLDRLLSAGSIDYVGTRLHAGLRALQHARRSLIVSVDNRATEMGRDFDLPVLHRSRIDQLETRLRESSATRVRLPLDAIGQWRKQFAVEARKEAA